MRIKSKYLLALGAGLLVAALSVASVAAQATPNAQATPKAGPPAAGVDWTCPCADGTGTPMGPRGGAMGGFGMGSMWGGEAVAKALGMSADQIATEMRNGKSLAQIASDKGVTNEALVSAILADHKANLDKSVADGRMTQAQADAMQERMKTQVQAMLDANRAGPMGLGRGGMMGPRFQSQDGSQAPRQGYGPGSGPMGRNWQNQDGTQAPAPRMNPGTMGRWGASS